VAGSINPLAADGRCDGQGGEDAAIAICYCDFHSQQERAATDIVEDILRQLVVRGSWTTRIRATKV